MILGFHIRYSIPDGCFSCARDCMMEGRARLSPGGAQTQMAHAFTASQSRATPVRGPLVEGVVREATDPAFITIEHHRISRGVSRMLWYHSLSQKKLPTTFPGGTLLTFALCATNACKHLVLLTQ